MRSTVVMRHGNKQRGVLITGILALALLPGCADTYSDAIVYELRQDPIPVKKPEAVPVAFQYKADPPGQLPLLHWAGMADPRNPYYHLRNEADNLLLDPTRVRSEERNVLDGLLKDMFGTPAKPRVRIPGVEELDVNDLKLDRASLTIGSKLYRLHCLACHGIPGDGRGPTAQWVNPHPRDYRAGLFKFQSVDFFKYSDTARKNDLTTKPKPLRDDLYHTLYYGVEGTSMPAFNLFTEVELDALVSYVIHLSMRGEIEQLSYQGLSAEEDTKQLIWDKTEPPFQEFVFKMGTKVFNSWKEAQKLPITAVAYPKYKNDDEKKASIQRGRAMFLANVGLLKEAFPNEGLKEKYPDRPFQGKDEDGKPVEKKYSEATAEEYEKIILPAFASSASCVTCHGDYGRNVVYDFDEWGTLTKPANLTVPVYRGGRKPIDIYHRIHSGIHGSGMLGFGKDLKGEQLWDLVNFVQILPYPAMRTKYGIEIE